MMLLQDGEITLSSRQLPLPDRQHGSDGPCHGEASIGFLHDVQLAQEIPKVLEWEGKALRVFVFSSLFFMCSVC